MNFLKRASAAPQPKKEEEEKKTIEEIEKGRGKKRILSLVSMRIHIPVRANELTVVIFQSDLMSLHCPINYFHVKTKSARRKKKLAE